MRHGTYRYHLKVAVCECSNLAVEQAFLGSMHGGREVRKRDNLLGILQYFGHLSSVMHTSFSLALSFCLPVSLPVRPSFFLCLCAVPLCLCVSVPLCLCASVSRCLGVSVSLCLYPFSLSLVLSFSRSLPPSLSFHGASTVYISSLILNLYSQGWLIFKTTTLKCWNTLQFQTYVRGLTLATNISSPLPPRMHCAFGLESFVVLLF